MNEPRDFVEGALTYAVAVGEKPVSASTEPGGRVVYTGAFEERTVKIRNARPLAGALSLDREGFLLARGAARVADFHDAEALRRVFYPSVEARIRELSGASRVLIFDHTLRSGDEAAQAAGRLREPVRVVHNDYTEWSGPQRVRDLLPEEAEALLRRRVAVIQMWQPVRGPVRSMPLAICDARSLAAADLIAAERRHPDRVGETYHVSHSPDHRWYYVPDMREDEALLFKTYDSERAGRARFTAHASFRDPTSPAGAPPRESIELRALAFFASLAAGSAPE